uniref:Calcineurin-like phosphoesterase domain-containing protein n=1 Tax=Pyramimonas obovata TaxID=1411642 RepID=A0A7S0RGT9_9CHLO|mmetsp:Transcript_3398/g.7067  ORF Transcript_3398/g.7067 Transcript_3398/m.7067 type:complete len:524 (+) Transcript_3398:72-1643(+)
MLVPMFSDPRGAQQSLVEAVPASVGTNRGGWESVAPQQGPRHGSASKLFKTILGSACLTARWRGSAHVRRQHNSESDTVASSPMLVHSPGACNKPAACVRPSDTSAISEVASTAPEREEDRAPDCFSIQKIIQQWARMDRPQAIPVPPRKPAHPPLYVRAPGRVVAIGDLHGDWDQTIRSLKIAGVIDEDVHKSGDMHWTGGDTHLVQLGDVLDRGDDEMSILMLLVKLQEEASEAGGAVHLLSGNHEIMNVAGDFRCATEGAIVQLDKMCGKKVETKGCSLRDGVVLRTNLDQSSTAIYKRIGMYAPGGVLTKHVLSRNHTVLVVNDTCFVHGGLRLKHVTFGLDKMNMCVSAWMLQAPKETMPDMNEALHLAAGTSNSALWCRQWARENISQQERERGSLELQAILRGVSAEVGRPVNRMVMGHTVQTNGINSEFGELAWRIDVGVSRGIDGAAPEALQILHDKVSVLRGAQHRAELPFTRHVVGQKVPERDGFREKQRADSAEDMLAYLKELAIKLRALK